MVIAINGYFFVDFCINCFMVVCHLSGVILSFSVYLVCGRIILNGKQSTVNSIILGKKIPAN